MNILSIGGSYRPANNGNSKRISTMCQAFVELGHNVVVCTCSEYKVDNNDEIIAGVKVRRFEDFSQIVRNIDGMILQYSIDILLIHEETYLRKLKFKRVKIPIVYECHAIEPNPNKYKEFILRFVRKIYFNNKTIKRIFVLSKNAKKQLCDKFDFSQDNVLYTPNGIEKNTNKDKRINFGEGKDFIYGYAGTLYEFQGIKILLRYSKQILSIADDVKIMIVGGGMMWNEVCGYVEENNLTDRIILTGSVNQEQFDKYIDEFDVMLMPRPSTLSTESAVPLKIFDAAKHKKPVVMSNVTGLTEAFSNDAALIYDTKRPDDFVECCKKIYRNKALAFKLISGEEKAIEAWPSVYNVARTQLNAMNDVINERNQI